MRKLGLEPRWPDSTEPLCHGYLHNSHLVRNTHRIRFYRFSLEDMPIVGREKSGDSWAVPEGRVRPKVPP